jgi:hypothetical protein
MEPVNILCGENTELMNMKAGDAYKYLCALMSSVYIPVWKNLQRLPTDNLDLKILLTLKV